MRKLYLFAAMAAMLAACSSDDLTKESAVAQQNAEEASVQFDVYTSRSTTRAGVNGTLTTENFKTLGTSSKIGFGVFAYYTNGESYTGSSKPDFMYNQNVYWNSTTWFYSPIKYWPNEFGDDAVSDQVDKVTLFAYAPWVEVTPLTGLVTAAEPNNAINITGMTRNNATGDPFVKYTSSMIADNSVDLCYGVAAQKFTSSNSAVNQNSIKAGDPYVDVVKPGTDANSKIKFDFKHALAQLTVTIDANVTDLTNNVTTVDTKHSRIWVRSVTFEGITQTGALNLNSNGSSPNWYDVNGTNRVSTGSLTVYDGRKDGREANEVAASEKPATLNSQIVQSAKYSFFTYPATGEKVIDNSFQGVTDTKINLFRNTDPATTPDVEAPVFVIPTNEKMKVTIVYDVETWDDNLASYLSDGATKGSTIENRISKTIDAFGDIEAGKHYTLNLHLGMRTVDFDAAITPWLEYGSDVDLPSNLQTFRAKPGTTGGEGTVTLAPELNSYTFAVSGLVPNATPSTVNATLAGSTGIDIDADPANGSGISIVKVTSIVPNTTVVDNSGTWVVDDGTNKVTLTVKQLATKLGLSIASVANSTNAVITLKKGATGSEWTAVTVDADHVKVTKNGHSMEVVTGTPAAGQVKFDTSAGTLTFSEQAKIGDLYTVWIQAGNAPAESVTAKIGGVYFTAPTTSLATTTGTVTNKASVFGTGTVVYSSSAIGTATVDSSTGLVTGVAAGSATITATLTPTYTDGRDGFYYPTNTLTDTYDITVP